MAGLSGPGGRRSGHARGSAVGDGTIGTDVAAKSAPDGCTLVISQASPHGFAPGIHPQLPHDPVADFTHPGMLVNTPRSLLITT